MRSLRQLLMAVVYVLPVAGMAQPSGYATVFDRLARVDLTTAQATDIGPIGYSDVEGLAFSPDGMLYGAADLGLSSGASQTDLLLRIDPATGQGTLVGPLSGLAGLGPGGNLDYGLAFTCDGRLWLSSDTTDQLWEVSPATGSTRLVGSTGAAITGLAGRGNVLYGIGVGTQKNLYRIDLVTGAAILIGPLGIAESLSSGGADFDAAGQLWATLDSQPPDVSFPSRLARIDPVTGAATIVAPIAGLPDSVSARGFAIGPPGGCSVGTVRVTTIPSTSDLGLGLLAALIALLAWPALRRHAGG
ncbi:MAG TPA: IPTL-CTERM sorting domain-containing protein [Xanthomonadaceae bacterium]|nr:IPTL-CTERM sorting domain-containing protein [Xanthomonadaceae bacterium]